MRDLGEVATFHTSEMEISPMCIYLVKNDSKGDKLLFRYPFCNFGGPVKVSATDQKRLLHKESAMDETVRPHELNDFTDDVISSLFAVKAELCGDKFELKVNNVRFVGYPIQIQTGGGERGGRRRGSGKTKPESPSIILINIVFALDSFARRKIVWNYYELSRCVGIALKHEEKRCGYLSSQIKDMLTVHDSLATGSECDLDISVENDQHFEKILKTCSLGQFLKRVFEDISTTGKVNMKVNNWIDVSYCVTSKVHRFFRDDQYFEPSFIDKCLKGVAPYHGLLLLADRKVLLDSLPLDTSPSVVRVINMYSPVKSLETLSADSDLTIAQVFNIAGHLVYWGDATLIFPLSENNLYTVAPHVPTERNNKYALKFKEKFPDYDLLEVMSEFSFPTSLQYKMCPVDDKSSGSTMIQILIWLLQHKILLQLHTFIYFMPSSKGLGYYPEQSDDEDDEDHYIHPSEEPMTMYQLRSENDSGVSTYSESMCKAEEMFHKLDEAEQMAMMHIPASANPDDFQLLMRLLRKGYFKGKHHIEEIMYLQNIRRSDLLQLLDKFKDVLVIVEMQDPIISCFYSQ